MLNLGHIISVQSNTKHYSSNDSELTIESFVPQQQYESPHVNIVPTEAVPSGALPGENQAQQPGPPPGPPPVEITDVDVIARLQIQMSSIYVASGVDGKIDYMDYLVSNDTKDLLVAIFEKFMHSIDIDGNIPEYITPTVEMSKIPRWVINGNSYGVPVGHHRISGAVNFTYQLSGGITTTIGLLSAVACAIDMRAKSFTNANSPLARYGKGWLTTAMPKETYLGLCALVAESLGYIVLDKGFKETPDGKFVTFSVSIGKNLIPQSWVLDTHEGQFTRGEMGTIPDIYQEGSLNYVFMGSMAFGVTLRSVVPQRVQQLDSGAHVSMKITLKHFNMFGSGSLNIIEYFQLGNNSSTF